MATTQLKSTSLITCFFASVLFIFSTSSAKNEVQMSQVMLQQICSNTMNANVCFDIFINDPRTTTADLYGLATISINRAIVQATDTGNFIKKMLESAANIQEQLKFCLDSYLMLAADGYHANESFNKRDYAGMIVNGQAITAGATKCEDVFNASSNPSYLTDKNLKMEILGQMIATMSTKLI